MPDVVVPARVSLVTLGVADVNRSRAFYRALGWETSGDADDFAVLRTAGALVALYPAGDLARDVGEQPPAAGEPAGVPRRTHLSLNVGSPEEVDAVVAEAMSAGAGLLAAPAEAEWGGYTAIVADPDGHAWEVAHNPGWPLGDDGLPRLP